MNRLIGPQIALAVILVLNGCDDAGTGERAPTAAAGEDSVRLEELYSIRGQFGDIVDVATDATGRIVVADGLNGKISIYADDGSPLATFGSQGLGPGEFEALWSITVRADTVFAYDNSLRRVTAFNLPSGEVAYTTSLPRVGSRQPNRIVLVQNHGAGFLVRYETPNDARWLEPSFSPPNAVLKVVDASGRVLRDSIAVLKADQILALEHPRWGPVYGDLPLGRRSLAKLGPDGRLYTAWTDSAAVVVTDLRTGERGRVELAVQNAARTDADLEHLYTSYVAVDPQLGEVQRELVELAVERQLMPESKPAIADFIVDSRGWVWFTVLGANHRPQATRRGHRYVRVDVRGARKQHTAWAVFGLRSEAVQHAYTYGDVVLFAVDRDRAVGVRYAELDEQEVVVMRVGGE